MIDLGRDGDVFVLRMTEGQNRIDGAFLEDFARALDEVEACSDAVALVTTGVGRFYSTGLDLEWLGGEGLDRAARFLERLHRLFGRLLGLPLATVAAINGHAFAAGAMISLSHDFRVMRADRGHFCLPEIDLATGRPLTDGMYALIRARLTPAAFHEALVTGRRYTAEEARDRGIVNEAVAESEVLPRAVAIARTLAGKDASTLGALKRGLFADALAVLGSS